MNREMKNHHRTDLRTMSSVTVSNDLAAEELGIEPRYLAEFARRGKLDWPVVICGRTVLHSREGLLRFRGA